MNTARKSPLPFTVLAAVLFFTAVPALRAEDADRCQRRIQHAEHHGHVLKCGPRSWRTKTDLPPQESAE